MIESPFRDLEDYINKASVDDEMDILSAISAFCEERGLEIENAALFVKKCKVLMSKVTADAASKRLIRSEPGLPI